MDNPDELGGQKWLVYPALIIVYVALFLALLLGPASCLGTLFAILRVEHIDILHPLPWSGRGDLEYWLIASMFIAAVTGLWWLVLGCAHKRWPALLPAVFHPFAGELQRAWVNRLMATGACVFIIFVAAGVLLVKYPVGQSG